MNEINMNKFGMPKSGVEVLREKMFGGMSLEDGPELPELELPEVGNVGNEPVLMGGVQRMVDKAKGLVGGKEAEAKWRINGLRSLVLMDRDGYFKENVAKHPELNYLTPDRVRADKKGFNMLLGGELSRVIGDGNTYGVLNAAIESMPEEERLGAKARLQQCDTEYKAHELLGELWSGLMQRDFDEAKAKHEAEAEKNKERASAALAAVNAELSETWVKKVMSGIGYSPVSGLRSQEALASGAMTQRQLDELEKTSLRAARAFDELMKQMHKRRSYVGHRVDVSQAAEARKKEIDGSWSFGKGGEVTDEEIWKQTAHDMSSSYKLDRAKIASLVELMKREDGSIDSTAFALFAAACHEAAYGEQAILSSDFWGNFTSALSDWGSETLDFADRVATSAAAETGLMPSGGLFPIPMPTGLHEAAKERQAILFTPDVEKVKGLLARVEDVRRSPAEGMSWVQATLTELGETAGDSAPFLLGSAINPMLGYAAFFPARTNEAIADNYYEGVTNPVAMAYIEGAWDTLAEGLFAKTVGKLPGVSKGLDWVGLKTVSVPAIGKTLGRIQGNAALRVSTNIALESVGELVVENVVAETGTYATVKLLRALGVDFAEPEWKPFESSWQMMQNSSQTGATVAYCASLGLLGVPANRRAARDFAKSRKFLLEVGLTEGGVAEVQAAHAEYQKSASAALVREKYRLEKVRAEAGDKAVEEAENKAGRPLEGKAAEKIRAEAGEKAVAEEVEKILAEQQGALDKTMRRVYDRDVLREDPVALKKRMEKRGEKFLEDVEVKLYAESGVRDAVLAEAGVTVGEKSEKGLRKVQFKGEKEGEVKEVEWTDEQLNAYVAMQREGVMAKRMRYFQAKVAGTALAEAEVTDASVKHELVNMRALPARALARMQRNGGQIDYAVMQDLAEDAAEKISGFVAGGMSAGEARAQMSELPGVTLGTLVQSANAFVQRVEELAGTAEGRALGINKPEDAVTNVFRMSRANAPGQSVLLYNKGLASEREVVEDLLESDVVAAVEGEHASTSWEALEGMLRRVEGELMKHGGGRLFGSKEKASQMAIIEAFSKLGQSYFLLNHGKYQMSAEAHGTIEYVQKKMADAQHLVALSHAWEAFAKSKEGKAFLKKEGASFEKLLSDAGASVAGHYAAAKFDADAFAAVREAYEGSIVPSLEAAKPVLEQYEAEQKALDRPAAEAEGLVVPADESVTGEELKLEPEAVVDDSTGDFVPPEGAQVVSDVVDKGRGLVGGNYVLMDGGSVYGVAEVESIGLSEDVPQFKKKDTAVGRVEADADGTTHELAGGWNANSAPIHVWRRVDGRLEVISGRHRLAHAKKNGVKHIAVRVYDEAAGYDAKWAKLHDVEQNILDNTCNAIDVAYYFRNNPMPLGEAEARGLMPKTKQGEQTAASRMGLHVAAHASDDTFAMLVNGGCTAEDAYMACLVAASAEGQQLALEARAGKKGKKNSWEYVTALVRGAEQLAPADGGGMLDLFGNDESFRESSEKMARYVAAVRAGLKARLNVLQSAGRLNKKESVSKELGVKVKAPKDALRLIERIAMLDAAYERLDYELGIPAKVDAWDGKSAVPTKLDELEAKGTGVSYSLASAEMEAIKAAAVADGTFMKAPNGKASNLNERQWLQVRTTAFREWFGDWKRAAELTFDGSEYNNEKCLSALKEEGGEPFINKETGISAGISSRQRSKITSGKAQRKSIDSGFTTGIHNYVAAHIRPLFMHATHVGDYKDREGGQDILAIKRFVCPVKIKGEMAYAYMSVWELKEHGHKLYTLELDSIEKLGGNLDEHFEEMLNPTPSKDILTRVNELSKTYFDNVSKIVDENGEPKVMYHGSPVAGIREFEMHKAVHGEGAFFTDSPEEALSYTGLDEYDFEDWDEFDAYATESGLLYEVFLNIRDRDRLYERSGGAWHARAIAPNEIKSATDNRGTFDGSNPDITFSMERNLAAVHSLSAEKFLGALELGGMPLPSVAVTRLDKPYSWGGADGIALVGRPELVDPKKRSKVYMHDAYTGKMPPVMYRKKNKEGIAKLREDAKAKLEPYGISASSGLNSELFVDNYNESVLDGHSAQWADNRAMMAYWAITQAGYAPKPKMKEVQGKLPKEMYKALKPWEKSLPKDVRFSYEYTDADAEGLRAAMVGYLEAKGSERLAEKWREKDVEELKLHALDFAADVRNYSVKKEPDGFENAKRFVAYVERKKKAYAAWCDETLSKFLGEKVFSRKFVRKNWRGEVVDEWWGHEPYSLNNLMKYMREEKSRGGEMSSMSPGMFLACVAEELRSMKDMQARRERVVDGETYNEAKKEYEEAYSQFEKLGWKLGEGRRWGRFEIAESALWRLLELVQGGRNMPSREAVERKLNESKDGWQDEHVDAAMDLLSKALTMPSDYMEAVPQRAVKMDEWEYAVMPEALKKNKAVMAGLRENGIKPRFHDGTEEGRRAALAGLVNDSKVSFSVIGQKAATWDKYADRAFKGRDDGKLRAEIDASGARLKTLTGAAAYDYRREVENVQDFWRKRYARWLELDALFDAVYYSDEEATEEQRAEADAAKEEYYTLTEEVKDMMEALIERGGAWRSYSQLEAADKQALRMGMVRSLSAGKVDEAVYEKLGALSAGEKIYSLEDVLDFPELYEAYPMLKLVPVQFELLGRYNGLVTNYAYGAEYSVIKLNKPLLENADALRSTLLHEVQHVIQRIEGYAKGGNVEGVYKQMKKDLEFNEWEMKRLARELRWFSALDYAKDYLKSARRLLRFPNAWKYNGLRYRHWKAALGNEDMTRLLVDDIAEQYEELRKSDELETKRRGNRITPQEYALPLVDFSSLAGIERGLAELEGLKPRRSAYRGVAPKKDKEYLELMKYTNAAKRMLDKYELEPYELYRRLAGEIEARNVQARRDWTAAQRAAKPFNETLEYPGEALVTFSIQGIIADWNMEVDNFVQNPPVHKSSEWRQDVYVCPTPAVMRMVGAAPLDIVMSHHVLTKVLDKDTLLGNGKTIGKMYPKEPDMGKHKMTVDELRKLPIALTSPVCIAESNRKGSIEVITDMQENGVNVLVAVQLEVVQGSSQYIKVNRIASLYGKEKIEQLVKHPMLYVNTAKAHKWLVDGGLQLPTVPNLIAGSKKRVLTPTDLVKYKFANGLSFSLTGRGMIDAAPLGKMAGEDKMQRLLNYARKEAARWTRTFGKDTPNARAAEAMGTVSSILASIHKELPPRFRPRVDVNMRYVEVYARLLESGKVRAYGKLKKEERAAVEAELLDALREAKAKADAEYELAKKEALDAAELTGEMAAMEAAEEMDVDDEVKRAAYLDRLAKRTADATRRRLLADAEAKKKQLEADIDALTRDFAAEKLAQIASRMLNDAADAVEAYLIDEELGAVDVLMERLAPRKLPNGKYDKGKMSADAYRKFVSYVELMNKSKAEVAEKMEQLGLLIAAEEAKSEEERMDDGAKLDALTEELAEWSTFGNLRGKKLESVRAGVQALTEFAVYEKNAWQGMLQMKRKRIKRQALNAAEALGRANEFRVKAVVEAETGTIRKGMNLVRDMQSISQMFYAMGGVPELRALADESLDALSAGHVALASREKRAFEQLAEYMKKEMGLDTEKKRNDFMASLKKLHNTGIIQEGELVRHRLKLTLAEAAEWLELSKAERDAKRAEMEAAADKQKVLAENVPYEEDIPLIREELRRIQDEESSAKYVRTVRVFRRPAATEPMKLSKDEALNILLLCEQADYIEAAHDNGYTDEVLAKLTEFVGSDVLGFGYAMREVLENNGLAEVYEAREGVPFPKVANYWPGNFDQSARANEQANALDPTSGNGTRYGMLITRVKHNLKFNILGATNVFMAALAQQNNYIVIGELTSKWRQLLSHSDFAMALKAHMGDHSFKKLKELINLLDGAGVQESVTQQSLSGLTAIFQNAHAMAVLAGSPVTLIKQVSAMLNAGAWHGISMLRVAARLILDRAGKGAIKYSEMLKKDYFQARYKDNRYFTEMLQLGRDANWSRLSKWARMAMGGIEKMDVLTNCASMTALYNITYSDLQKRNKDAVDPLAEEELHAECDRVVRNTLELGAQPLRRTQKSAFAALGNRNTLVKTLCYMSSEAINKIGMAQAVRKREGRGWKGFLKAWKYVAGLSFAQQLVVMAIDMARGADPIDDDEWAEWALLNLVTGASGLGILQTVPLLGEALQWGSRGYVKTGSMGEMVYDFGGMAREVEKAYEFVAFNSEDSVEIKKSRKSPYWQVTYKKQDGSRVTTSTNVPVDGGEFEGVELSKEEAEAKALEVGKKIAEQDAPGWADWGMMGSNLLRYATAFTGAWKGINSTSKTMSELSGMLQSMNAVVNTVRPVMQAKRNEEKREKEFKKKLEKGLAKARKATREREKQEREAEAAEKKAEREKREKAKRREERLERM